MEENKTSCPNCGKEIDFDAAFCPYCGIRRKLDSAQNNQAQTPPQYYYSPQDQNPPPQYYPQQNPNPSQYYPLARPPKEKFIGYIFISTLIMMILSVMSNSGIYADFSGFKDIISKFKYDESGLSGAFYFFITLSVFEMLLLVWVFIASCVARNQRRDPVVRVQKAKMLHILMIVSVAFTALFILSAFMFYGKFGSVVDFAKEYEKLYEKTDETDLVFLLQGYLNAAIMYGLVYLGLGFAGIFKSANFKRLTEENLNQAKQTKANNNNIFGL